MGPIEFAFLALWIVFGIIGWVRGFFRELGITVIIFATLIAIYLLDRFLVPRVPSMLAFAIDVGVLIFGVLIAYQGQTITYSGKDLPGWEGDIWGIAIGLFNGWLVIGTLWYYINKYNYPLITIQPPLTGLAMTLLSYLPFNFIPAGQLQYFLIGALLFLLLLRVIR